VRDRIGLSTVQELTAFEVHLITEGDGPAAGRVAGERMFCVCVKMVGSRQGGIRK